jgi:hypothetical protein
VLESAIVPSSRSDVPEAFVCALADRLMGSSRRKEKLIFSVHAFSGCEL